MVKILVLVIAGVVSAIAVGGIYSVAPSSSPNAGGGVFVVNRLTGGVRICNPARCIVIPDRGRP